MKIFTSAILLAISTTLSGNALATDTQWEFERSLVFAREQSAKNNNAWSPAQEMSYVQDYYNRWQTYKQEGYWSWWWKQYSPGDYKNYVLPANYTSQLLGFTPYVPTATGTGSVILQSQPYGPNGSILSGTPQALVEAGFASVQYQASFTGNDDWQTIGQSSDAASGYAVNYTFNGFEPIIKAVLLDGSGQAILLTDSQGNLLSGARMLAVAVPEASSWALALVGLGVLVGAKRRAVKVKV